MRAAKEMQGAEASREFDDAFTSHIGHVLRNGIRTLLYGLTASIAPAPKEASKETKHYYRHVSRLSAAFAFLADVSMLAMGGALKRKEKISGRLGDVLSMMYLVSATLKRYEDEGRIREDLPLVRWAVRDALYNAQQAIDGILSNFPVKALARFLRWAIFPMGMSFRPPLDSRNHECAKIALAPGAARDRLTAGMFVPADDDDPIAILEAALGAVVAAEPIEQKMRAARARTPSDLPQNDVESALTHGVVTPAEAELVTRARALRRRAIMVDDFPKDLGRSEIHQTTQPVTFEALRGAAAG